MRKLVLGVVVAILHFLSCNNFDHSTITDRVKAYHSERIKETEDVVLALIQAIKVGKGQRELQELFLQARLAYKRTEFFTEYYSPLTARFINGAPIPEIDVDDQHRITEPEGFQVIEPFLFPNYSWENKTELLKEAHTLLSNVKRLKKISETNYPTNAHVFDALRLEIFRTITLGLSGFDAPASLNSVNEAKAVLSSVEDVLELYADSIPPDNRQDFNTCLKSVEKAMYYLSSNPDFNSFNRIEFITGYANPITSAIVDIAEGSGFGILLERRPLKATAKSLFDKDAFNADYYIATAEAASTEEKTELGKLLFFDPILSGSGNRSCASCHNPLKGFTDGVEKNLAISRDKKVLRNTPTILNAALQPALFYDLRVSYLEDQAADVINNKDEMHGSLVKSIELLKKSKDYKILFQRAFPKLSQPITEFALKNAIGSYIRSLSSLNSPFDKYIRGDKTQLNAREVSGFNLFMGKAKCGTCHFTPLFNGTVPPNFEKIETEIIGVPLSAKVNQIDTDPGRFTLRRVELHRNAFKTPTVRNIALTAPYMHNGIYSTLEEVIDFYNEGGGVGLGIELENQTLPFDKLNLTEKEKQNIVAFLKKLTDTSAVVNVPNLLPPLSGSNTKRRVNYHY